MRLRHQPSLYATVTRHMRKASILATLTLLLTSVTGVSASPSVININMKLGERLEIQKKPLEVKYVFDRTLGRGRTVKVQDGVEGRVYTRFAQIFYKGELVAERQVKQTIRESEPAVYAMGPSGFSTSRGSFTRAQVRVMESTAYTPDAGRGAQATFRTRTGRRAAYGVVAVDPRVIPLNTLLFVEGYGFAVAADTGGAIKGNIIDVCLPTNSECMQWGRRNVTVHIFREKVRPGE